MKQPPKSLGLYIHIPFCKSKCIYCDFYSLPRAEQQMDGYVSALCRHLEESASGSLSSSYWVDTVYFGGGTPSYLGEKRLRLLLKTIRKRFQVSDSAEITLEANPDSLGGWRTARALRQAGFNRLSLGVQSASNRELRALGRPHTFQQAEQTVEAARQGGFDNLSLDLIYGLPGQSLADWQRTVEKAAALEPEHLSCYGLKVEEDTPLWHIQGALDLPDGDLQADMYLWTVDRLAQLGYGQYEISNFARPGRESRHNLKYWTLGEYAGFGPGAHSDVGGVRYAFVRDLAAYCRCVEEGGEILSESDRIAPWDRDLEYLMLGLRTALGISGREFESRYRLSFEGIRTALERYQETGYALETEGRWRLTPEGFLVSNLIIGEVLEVLAEEKQRRDARVRR